MRIPPGSLIALMFLGACSVDKEPVYLRSIQTNAASPISTVGVVQFEDLRPPGQIEGAEPRLIPLLVWNQRIGDHVTGEKSFLDDVSDAVTSGVAAALSGGSLGSAHVISDQGPQSPDQASTFCAGRGLRWIVTGSVQDLYGTLHQRSYLLIVPTPWAAGATWDSDKTDPIGVARIIVQIYDCAKNERVFEREYSSEQRSPGATMAQAAKLALNDVLQKLGDTFSGVPSLHQMHGSPEQRAFPGSF